MKNKNNIIFGVISVIVIVAIVIISPMLTSNNKAEEKTTLSDQELFSKASIESNNIKDDEKKDFYDIDVDTYLSIAHEEEKSLVLVGRNGCQYCKIAEPIIQNIMYKYDLTINYVSTDYFDEESYQRFSNSNDLLKSFATPLLMVVSNDQINDSVQGLLDTDGYMNFFTKNGFINGTEE